MKEFQVILPLARPLLFLLSFDHLLLPYSMFSMAIL